MNGTKLKILIIDDEKLISWSLAKQFEQLGYETITAASGEEGLEKFDKLLPEVVFLDNKLPAASGLEVLQIIRHQSPSTIVFFMTAYGTIDTAVEAMRIGAYDYINKPIDFEEVRLNVEKALKANKINNEVLSLRRELRNTHGISNIISDSPQMRHIFEIIRKITSSEATTVLIEGESGTGKELVARVIHFESSRFQKPFEAINCAALPETLLESELFGFEKGAFTDAKQMKRGQFELADGGTLLLDEIGEISTQMQVKLLRVLETRSFKRLGGMQDIKMNVRVIASTNRDLMAAMENGSFRRDLYFRLKVINIHLPPLRDRHDDILKLTQHFISVYNNEFSKNFTGLDDEAKASFLSYQWPGNVRELKNVIERVLILESDSLIRQEHLPSEFHKIKSASTIANNNSGIQVYLPEEGFSLEELEKIAIVKALALCDGNQSRAASLLSITRDTIRYKMKKHGLLV